MNIYKHTMFEWGHGSREVFDYELYKWSSYKSLDNVEQISEADCVKIAQKYLIYHVV